jgi:hypothetical protein
MSSSRDPHLTSDVFGRRHEHDGQHADAEREDEADR